ncbi:hypothetical protein OPV22_019668 [Ensete ventricosum]|uniref:Uncharacterized protein n=1 Tax=Ensete ventricosum TaxID=4639 RepID=A0AAV8P922_ENSVE|nr:hypothetical protein OPV22_019668 [Ensete ventricosum]
MLQLEFLSSIVQEIPQATFLRLNHIPNPTVMDMGDGLYWSEWANFNQLLLYWNGRNTFNSFICILVWTHSFDYINLYSNQGYLGSTMNVAVLGMVVEATVVEPLIIKLLMRVK